MSLDDVIKNIEDNDEKIEGSVIEYEEEGETLTSAQMEQIISLKRDALYKRFLNMSIIFALTAIALMAAFKFNEDFFDANSRFGLLMDSVNAQEENLSYPKINIHAEFDDKHESKLVIPFSMPIDNENVNVREEFTQNKFVVTLSGASENIADGIRLISDSSIMDAVGIYRQNLDVVVEVYCRDLYSCLLENNGDNITLDFYGFREGVSAVAVVYLPYEDRNRLALPEWQSSFAKYENDNSVRLFIASNMQEPYTQQDIVDFAHYIDADALIGFQAETDLQLAQTQAEVVCNTAYFISEFNSAQLAVIMAEKFYMETQIMPRGFVEADENTLLILNAKIPAALINIELSQKDANSVEQIYKLNGKLVSSIESTLSELLIGGYIGETKE